MCRTESSGNPLISGPYVQDNQQPSPKNIKSIQSIDNDPLFTIYPNPMLSNHITIETEIMYNVIIYTTDGREIYSEKLNDGTNSILIPQTDHKIYIVKMIDSDGATPTSSLVLRKSTRSRQKG